MLNKLLLEHITKKYGSLDQLPESCHEFLSGINETMDQLMTNQNILKRSIEMNTGKVTYLNDKLKEETLQTQNAHAELETLFETIEDVIFSVDMTNEVLLQMSKATEKVFGYPSSDFFKNRKLWFDLMVKEDRGVIRKHAHNMYLGKTFSSMYRINHADGSIRWVETKITPTLNNQGQLARIDGICSDITEKKKAEEELKLSRTHLLTSQRISRTGSWEVAFTNGICDDGSILFWTDETYRIFGYKPGEVLVTIGLFHSHVHPADLDAVKSAMAQAIETKTTYKIEHRIVLRDGSQKIVFERAEIVYDGVTGQVQKLIGTVQDISARKASEFKLKNTEADLRTILENTDTAYVLLDSKMRVLSYNHLADELAIEELGKSFSEANSYLDLMPSVRKKTVRASIRKVLSEGKQISYETKYTQANGDEKWLLVKMHPILNDLKQVIGVSIAARNITDRKESEQKIKQSNERYELVTTATNDVIWDWDIDNNKMYRSANYHSIFGYDHTESGGDIESWISNIHPEDRAKVYNCIINSIGNPEFALWEDEYRYIKKSGELAYVRDRGYIIYDENNRPVRMVGAMSDVTKSKLAEIEKDAITRDLLQRNKDLEQFAYIVSHNLRSPVASIIGLSALWNNPAVKESEKEYISKGVLTSVQKLDEVIKDLNYILQVKNKLNEKKESVAFSDLVEDIKFSISDVIKQENVRIKCDFEEVKEMVALKSYLYSIFYNLISNSLKYKRKDTIPQIEITSRMRNNKIILGFKDNGIGIDLKKNGDKIFGLYKRFNEEKDGRGIGLFMVKTQVEALNGKIHVESEENKGTLFTVEFNMAS
jgi:PAS domain S-box-containing protein